MSHYARPSLKIGIPLTDSTKKKISVGLKKSYAKKAAWAEAFAAGRRDYIAWSREYDYEMLKLDNPEEKV